MNQTAIFKLSALGGRTPEYAMLGEVDLVVARFDDEISFFYGRCQHCGALMSDGHVRGKGLMCGVRDWDDRLDTDVSSDASEEKLPAFNLDDLTTWKKDMTELSGVAYGGLS